MEKENETKTVVPALRFPEFRECESWDKKNIDSILDCDSSQLVLSKLNFVNDGYPVYGADGIIGYIPNYKKDQVYISIVKDGSGVGRLNICSAYSSLLGTLNYLVSKNEQEYKIRWIYYLLQTIDFSNYIKGSGIPHIYFNNYKEQNIYISCPLEQQKIADCLSSLDELIEATNRKIEALKEHKKGLMQRLFPKEGENVPELRFPEFQGTQVWEDTILETVADYENGKAHENGIDENGNFIVVNSKFISTDGEVVKRTDKPYCLADKEDILMVLSDVPNGRAIAKCFFVDQSGKYTVNQRICRLRSKRINSKLLFYLINRNSYFLSFDDGVKQTNLKKSEVLECPLIIPSSPLEQQKIADLLSSIDDLIIATEQRIKALGRHKKGLMQQLFPKI